MQTTQAQAYASEGEEATDVEVGAGVVSARLGHGHGRHHHGHGSHLEQHASVQVQTAEPQAARLDQIGRSCVV